MDWESNVRRVTPYTPGEQPDIPGMIKLNTNEFPYPPSPKVRQVLWNTDELRLYPDPSASGLTQAIAKTYGVGTDQVFVGVGSDEVLALAFLAFFNSKKPQASIDAWGFRGGMAFRVKAFFRWIYST